MEYEKKYNEALERARYVLHTVETAGCAMHKDLLTEIFPELREGESEDERIRKEAISIVQSYMNICDKEGDPCLSGYKVIAWLEKQKDLDKMIVVSPEVWDNAISDAFENGKKEGEHPEKQKPSAPNKYDEKMRKKIIDHLESIKMGCVICTIDTSEEIAWLEKQKDASKAIEAVDRIDKYIDEHLANAHDMKDSNPDKKYYRGWDDALGKMAGILQDVYSGEKQKEPENTSASTMIPSCWAEEPSLQKEQKPATTEDMPYVADEHFYERTPADSFKYRLAEYMTKNCKKGEGPYGYSYSISSESILQMAKEELIKRGELKEQKPAEWSEKHIADVFEKVGLAKIVREQGNDALTNAVQSAMIELSKAGNTEWSEEDEKMLKCCLIAINHYEKTCNIGDHRPTKFNIDGYLAYVDKVKSWLKSLRPSWKPSEEQMEAMEFVIKDYREDGCTATANYLQEILDQIKKL